MSMMKIVIATVAGQRVRVASLCLLLALAGCRTAAPLRYSATALSAPDDRVLLSSGDSIEIKFFYSADLNDIQTIRPDGKISLQLVGDVQAAGRTPEELQAELGRLYAQKVEKPDVAVIVRQLQSRVVYVGGAVKEPGQFDMVPRLTALDAVMRAGGFDTGFAEYRKVVVIRHEGERYVGYGLDFKNALIGADAKPFYLKPKDVVFVPRTRIADMNTWIDQHITKMIPQIGLPVFFQVN